MRNGINMEKDPPSKLTIMSIVSLKSLFIYHVGYAI